jgi:FG-GAP repeat.
VRAHLFPLQGAGSAEILHLLVVIYLTLFQAGFLLPLPQRAEVLCTAVQPAHYKAQQNALKLVVLAQRAEPPTRFSLIAHTERFTINAEIHTLTQSWRMEEMTRSLQSAVMLTLLLCHTTLTTAQLRQHPDLPQGVSPSWWQQVQTLIRQSEYHICKRSDGRYTSPNRAHNLRFVYEPNGFSATRRDSLAHLWQARLTFAGLSKNGASPESAHAHNFTLTADANTLVAQSDALVIQYRNDEKGMRQDFIVKHKPDGNGDLRLWLCAEMQGGTVSVAAERISFLTASGAEAMRYSELKVWDASQKRLKARFEKVGDKVAIVVSDRHAMYPITIDPLSTLPNWTAESNQANAQFGFSVSSAGDVNGDGFSDVIVGAPEFDSPEANEGRVFVYHGSATGLSTTPNWTAESNQAGAQFGNSVASAGDVNGDGFSDVIVGAPEFDSPEANEGRVFVYHGSATGLSTTPSWTAESNQAGAQFGNSVASAGDVNGDGFSDVIVGAPEFDSPEANEGRVFVYHGSATGLSTSANWTAESNQAGAQFGNSVASAGDVNGDGFSDVIVGAYLFDNGQTDEGRAFVYHGSASGLSTTPNWTAESNQVNAYFGVSVASAGDVNGDGFSDVIVGARAFANGETDEGAAFVYHGSATGLSTSANWTAESNQAFANFGFSVSSAGDVNGDGFSDVIVGANGFENDQVGEGAVFIYHGSATGLSTSANWTAVGNQAGARFGWSVSSAGDVNGDGFSDVIVGAHRFDNPELDEGRAFVYHGSGTSFMTQTVNASGTYTFGTTGMSIAFTGVSGTGTCKVVRYDTPASNRAFAGASPTFVSKYRFVVESSGFSFTNAELRINRTQLPFLGGIANASTVTVYRRPTPGSGAHPTPGSGRFVALPSAFNSSFPDEVRATTTAFSEFILGSNDLSNSLPVELVEFVGHRVQSGVELVWKTASELNNAGFEVQRRSEKRGASDEAWQVLGFVRGAGTTSEAKRYVFVDRTATGKVQYRLKQVDFDGAFEYSPIIEVEAGVPRTFELSQNYPNPFNPSTVISYQLPVVSEVSLKVYDLLGREVATLVNQRQEAGRYQVVFDASRLASGVYFYRLQAGAFVETRKMMVVR